MEAASTAKAKLDYCSHSGTGYVEAQEGYVELKPYRSKAERTRVWQGYVLIALNALVLARVFNVL